MQVSGFYAHLRNILRVKNTFKIAFIDIMCREMCSVGTFVDRTLWFFTKNRKLQYSAFPQYYRGMGEDKQLYSNFSPFFPVVITLG